MRPQERRRFRILDGLVLVAAMAVGFAGCRFWLSAVSDDEHGRILWLESDFPLAPGLWRAGVAWTYLLAFPLLSSTLAVLVLRLWPIRPRRRRLWCQPGFLACVAVV